MISHTQQRFNNLNQLPAICAEEAIAVVREKYDSQPFVSYTGDETTV